MTCVICKQGETTSGTTALVLRRNSAVFVHQSVPAQVCENCGEAYLAGETTAHLLQQTEQAVHQGIQVAVREYSAA